MKIEQLLSTRREFCHDAIVPDTRTESGQVARSRRRGAVTAEIIARFRADGRGSLARSSREESQSKCPSGSSDDVASAMSMVNGRAGT